jgi:ribosomal protein L2
LDASKCSGGNGGGNSGGNGANNPPAQAPTKAPIQAKPVESICPNHVIKQGSTLSAIAKEYTDKGMSITWQQICSFNGIENCDHIESGEVIIIPVGNCAGAVKDGVTQAAVTQAAGGGGQTTQAAGGSNLRVAVDGSVATTVAISAGAAAVLANMLM